jgi:hypothetical protein
VRSKMPPSELSATCLLAAARRTRSPSSTRGSNSAS